MSRMKRFLVILGVSILMVTSTGCGTETSGAKSTEIESKQEAHSDQGYRDFVVERMEQLSTHFGAFTVLASNAKFGEAQWTTDMGMVLAGINITALDYLDYNLVPKGYEKIDAELDEAMKNYITFTEKMAKGVDNIDADLINQATYYMMKGSENLTTATRLINDKN